MEFRFNKIPRLRSTVYFRTKPSATNTFLELLRKERIFSDFKNFHKTFAKLFLLFYRITPNIRRQQKQVGEGEGEGL